jgi:hypothetical protein
VLDPVILRNTGVSVYEIPMEKTKLPMDEGVNVKDLGVDDNDGPNDTEPVEMATPAPNQKVWPDSDVNNCVGRHKREEPESRKRRKSSGAVVTLEARDSTYMSTDGSMVRLLMKTESIAACGRLVTGTNYPNLFLAKPKDNPSLGRRLRSQDTTIFTYINNQDDFLYYSSRGGKLEERPREQQSVVYVQL